MSKFNEWINTEIKSLKETASEENVFIQGKLSEAIRIRAIFNDITKSPEDLAAEICDWACRYPQAYDTGQEDDNDRLFNEKCSVCPVNELLKGDTYEC